MGELMGDSRKKRRSSQPRVSGSQRTQKAENTGWGWALGEGGPGGSTRGREVLHKSPPLSEWASTALLGASLGGGPDGLARPSGLRVCGPGLSICVVWRLVSGHVRSRGGLCAGTHGSGCACPSVFGVHLPDCGARGCWRACTCSLSLCFGASVCERAYERGCARDGRPWVCLGGWGRGWGKVALLSAFSRGSHTPLAFTVLK